MNMSTIALRTVPGAFILNAGIGKLGLDADSAAGMQGMAATGVPAVKQLSPEQFGKALAWGEIALGGALLAPFVSNRVAGLALGTFTAGMLSMYFRNDGMTQSDGVRPTQDGTPLAKDAWLAAIAIALVDSGKKSSRKKK
ncbi:MULTISPECIES: hypothetical protein [unclassified Nesterenkonia]|uniref:hypothetical protein n=1 Tax=unclassified Nesterenkonia TaxID=2629769 RepID=UPI001F4C82FA|nr:MULTISPECIES: hypothetical protein [unclassified Nesterenkonia]MCH8560131.1 hypothetical protein [Nesterenkonia sp. DZ6]MCH8564045.1 hypothetical protein [Nesterenkonia sp. YGD6]MCH8569785.1 hypothetical protein [Nesterenkonia sp. AY15]